MNFKKFINSDYLKSNPLCAISTYKDELNLATGACTRRVKKLVLDGSEGWNNNFGQSLFGVQTLLNNVPFIAGISAYSSHFKYNPVQSGLDSAMSNGEFALQKNGNPPNYNVFLKNTAFTSTADFKAWLAAQYANGTPVTIWYVLAEPTTETVTVPSGLSGIVEGSLTQTGTPTPTNPIYPTANTVEQWFDLNHYVMGTSTDTITTPADIYANGTTATVGLKGNMSQSSTPSPSSPIQPQECGERTGNLWDEDYTGISSTLKYVPVFVGDGIFTLSTSCPIIEGAAALFFIAGNVQSGASTSTNGVYYGKPITVTASDGYVTVVFRYINYQSSAADPRNEKTMLNSGSTALPYEPYGYKIPISSAGQTTPVYLGEVQTVRAIKKLVLTGQENWNRDGASSDITRYRIALNDAYKSSGTYNTQFFISHYKIVAGGYTNNSCFLYNSNFALLYVCVDINTYPLPDDFKSYLAAQYAAGTPVCVWYALATPTTGITNEPLMRIGDYADEVSGITIPTIAGANTISVDTTLQPSEVSVNYKGWHPVSAVHERENGAWT